jgi:hypothetical protein
MTSALRLAANQQNALHSTGPRTPQGKAASSRNAAKHNLCAVSPVLDDEEKLEFDRLLCEAKMDLAPRTHTEHALVEQAAYAEWKLLRIAAWEAELINATLSGRTTPIARLFGKTPHEALDRLHRYESATRRAWHNALRELRVIKKLRQDAAFVADYSFYIRKLKQRMDNIVEIDTAKTNPSNHAPSPSDDPSTPPPIASAARAAA